jgi:hypothetical protein
MTVPLAEWFATDIDLRHNQLINARAETTATPPVNPVKGQLWFDDTTKTLKYFDGTVWTGGRTYYNTVLDDAVVKPQRGNLNFRSTTSINVDVLDEGVQDQSSVQVTPKYGPVKVSQVPGESPTDGVAPTLARSDHSHGSPSASGADTVLLSWWEFNESLWAPLTNPANFIPDLPGQTVGGGWMMSSPGSIYWTGNVIPVSPQGVYRNSARISAVNDEAKVSMGWICYDATKQPVSGAVATSKVKCVNQVAVEPSTESGIKVNRNYLANPSMENPAMIGAYSANGWHSNGVFGAGSIATITQSTEQFHERTHSTKAVWAAFTGDNTQSNCIAMAYPIPPNTKFTFEAWVYVPSGSPRVRLDIVYYKSSAYTDLKDQWVKLQVQLTSANDGAMHDFWFGMNTDANAPGTVAYIDQAIVREGWDPIPGGYDYFDGSTTSTEAAVFAWDGDPDASPSGYYTLEPAWEVVNGYIASGDGIEPVDGEAASIEDAVNPLPGTVYFRPYVECTAGTMIIDTHEVARGSRDMTVMDGLHTGWVTADGQMEAGNVVTPDIAPPDTEPETLMRIGPVYDPPRADGDVVPKSYVDRIFGAFGLDETGSLPPVPPQFLWSGDPGVDPTPDDLGFTFDAWPLFSLWLDTGVPQVKPQVIIGTWQGGSSYATGATATSTWKQAPSTYKIVFNAPCDGTIIGVSSGSVYATWADYVELRCGIWSGVDEDGNGGVFAGKPGQSVYSGDSGGGYPRQGYTLIEACNAVAGERYRIATDFYHGGPAAYTTRDRSMMLFLPNVVTRP